MTLAVAQRALRKLQEDKSIVISRSLPTHSQREECQKLIKLRFVTS